MSYHDEAQQVYERLWAAATSKFSGGEVETDPHLWDRDADGRSGITLIARPGPEASAQFAGLVEELREQEPEQYFYSPDEFHVTVMTLITAAEGFDWQKVPVASYDAIFANLFKRFHAFAIHCHGITASPSSVAIQGYVDDNYLNDIRDAVRLELRPAGLAEALDRRYKIVTAHATIMRFRSQPRNLQGLISKLVSARDRDFGVTEIDKIYFVVNDWYMLHDRVSVLTTYPLTQRPVRML
jgi:2'-5' RNA ligase